MVERTPHEPKLITTPVRGLVRPERKPQSFRLAPDIPDLIREAQAANAAAGTRSTRDDIVDRAIREFVDRIREGDRT